MLTKIGGKSELENHVVLVRKIRLKASMYVVSSFCESAFGETETESFLLEIFKVRDKIDKKHYSYLQITTGNNINPAVVALPLKK